MIVRELRWGDFDDLRETYYRCYDERDAGHPIGITLFTERPSLADEVAWFAGLFRQFAGGESVVVVAEHAGHVIGNCTIGPRGAGRTSESGHVGELGILIHPDHRGQGVGAALLERAIAASRGRFDLIRLSVFATNLRARRLYERFGFLGCGRIPAAIRRGTEYVDEEIMILDLRPASPQQAANR